LNGTTAGEGRCCGSLIENPKESIPHLIISIWIHHCYYYRIWTGVGGIPWRCNPHYLSFTDNPSAVSVTRTLTSCFSQTCISNNIDYIRILFLFHPICQRSIPNPSIFPYIYI